MDSEYKGSDRRGSAGTMVMVAIMSAFVLLVSQASASGPGCTTTSGGNYCPSYQYRSNPGLAGSPLAPAIQTTLINPTNVNQLYNYFSRTTNSGGQYSGYGITSSPSVISRTIFASTDDNGNSGLWSFGVGGGSLGWHTTSYMNTGYIVGSPAWDAGLITVGDDQGMVYGFGYTDGLLSWTFKAKDAILSSPSVYLGASVFNSPEEYIVDASGNIYRLNGYSGNPDGGWTNQGVSSGVYGYSPFGVGAQGAQVSVNGKALFVAGVDNHYNNGVVSSYAKDGTLNWSNQLTSFQGRKITSAAVLNDSAQLVYVQPEIKSCVGPCHDELVVALKQSDGSQVWVGRPTPPLNNPSSEKNLPPCDSFYYYYSAGTPAYDQAQNRVIVSANAYRYDCVWNFLGSVLYSYDATNGGAAQWSASTTHSISYSSPTVANGVVYIGTDDGYILGFDESNGTLLWTSPQANSGDSFYSPPVVSFDRVHAVSQNGTLYVYCLPVSTPNSGCQISVQ